MINSLTKKTLFTIPWSNLQIPYDRATSHFFTMVVIFQDGHIKIARKYLGLTCHTPYQVRYLFVTSTFVVTLCESNTFSISAFLHSDD